MQTSRGKKAEIITKFIQGYQLPVGASISGDNADFLSYLHRSLQSCPETKQWSESGEGQLALSALSDQMVSPETHWRLNLSAKPLQCIDIAQLAARIGGVDSKKPIMIGCIPGNAIDSWEALKNMKDGADVYWELNNPAKVNSKPTFDQTYSSFEGGDLFFINGSSDGHVGVILETRENSGSKEVLVWDCNRMVVFVEGNKKTVSDGMPRLRWLSKSKFEETYVYFEGKPDNKVIGLSPT